ncbi:hypothetical protein [Pedosphaera parvula]|uniref:Immunoglobulin I-set domain protein n=1 Tax=Pedosphaera parvula (strain Ellin514) TaxID=320771 RepID=B9XIM5_PEDPL|nr:hypothetical protein [Pedosphaera parvula]EEF60288.1 Immunoglobulin I-set domain protein [Pedosphaera parvula Ellin514]
MKRFIFHALFGGILFLGASAFAQSPLINDNFENRIILSGNPVTFTGTLANATIQAGEPMGPWNWGTFAPWAYGYRNADASAWWSWTATATGPATLEVLNSSTSAFKLGGMDVWTGTDFATDFVIVGGVNLDIGRHPFFTFSATAGNTYHLRVVGTNYGDFTLRITETNTPLIVVQPASRTVTTNGSTYFGVVAAGAPPYSPPFSYQWRFNGVDLPGETFPILSLDNLTTNQSGGYSVVVSNQIGGTISDVAVLKVTETANPPQLMAAGSSDTGFEFKILGDVGRIYRIESSTNLSNWTEENSFPKEFIYYGTDRAKNGLVFSGANGFSVPKTSQRKFYRTTAYVPSNEMCINNLRKMRFAKELFSLVNKTPYYFNPTVSDLAPYFRDGPFCPLDVNQLTATSYNLNDENTVPTCKYSWVHLLEEPEY